MPCSRTQHGLTRVGLEPPIPLDSESEAKKHRKNNCGEPLKLPISELVLILVIHAWYKIKAKIMFFNMIPSVLL